MTLARRSDAGRTRPQRRSAERAWPWIETDIPGPSALHIIARLDGKVVQSAPTAEMVFGAGELLEYVTRWITLEPGDVLLTGSPAGVAPMAPGDVVEISGIGTLRNTVVDGESLAQVGWPVLLSIRTVAITCADFVAIPRER
ncbi:fumarylacetoacetate hydrolase family protein [Nocardia sp. CA-128927]|uniref:fumarylacetoacetate hydrolase family protein n=1 Tax=Nocardia sp. CA-128927 TaxID=3239975 RepID=UPI003D99C5A7